MEGMISALVVFGSAFVVFAFAFVALLRVEGTCTRRCDQLNETHCQLCPHGDPDDASKGDSP